MRCLGILLLGPVLSGCAVTYTSSLFSETGEQLAQTLRYCDPDTRWEVADPVAIRSGPDYRLPKTQLVVVNCNVRDPERFFKRAEREFEQFLLDRGAYAVSFPRSAAGERQHLSWKYEYRGREGLVTLWATPADGRITETYVTIHESRKAQ